MFETNPVIPVDIPIFNTLWGGIIVEDGYLLIDNRAERLVSLPCRIKNL